MSIQDYYPKNYHSSTRECVPSPSVLATELSVVLNLQRLIESIEKEEEYPRCVSLAHTRSLEILRTIEKECELNGLNRNGSDEGIKEIAQKRMDKLQTNVDTCVRQVTEAKENKEKLKAIMELMKKNFNEAMVDFSILRH